MWEINRPGGSLGRSQSCNLALRMWGDASITDQVLDRLARSTVCPQPVAGHRPQTTRPSRVAFSGGRLLLLLRPLLRRAVHRTVAAPPSEPSIRLSWRPCCSPCRNATAAGGTFRFTTTISPTARPWRSCRWCAAGRRPRAAVRRNDDPQGGDLFRTRFIDPHDGPQAIGGRADGPNGESVARRKRP